MNSELTCPACQQPLPDSAPQGLCPECLMRGGLPSGVEIGAATTASDLGAKPDGRFSPPSVEEIAQFFPQLEVLEFIGQGGMGAVYKARQKQLDRVVALKILPPGVGDDVAFAERFAREAKAMAKLSHPGIVTIHDFGQTDGLFYFLMEFVDGVTLWQLLNTGQVSPREALAIVPQICDALQYAHDAGIVHRDIKPENILLDRRGRVKVADFGLAKLVGIGAEPCAEVGATSGASALTGAGKVLGTPQYMAPEQGERPQEVDHRADIYSLGVVFYQLLTGELPNRPIEPPSKRVQVDVRLDEVVLRALEKTPERRYQQASVLKTQVETIASTPPAQPVAPRQSSGPGSGGRLPVLAGIFFLLPPAVFAWYLSAGDWMVGVDLKPDVKFFTGLLGLPLSAGVGAVLAWAIEILGSSLGLASDEVKPVGPRRWCWQAIVSVVTLVVSLPLGGAAIAVLALLRRESGGWNPGTGELVVTLFLFGGSLLTAAAATLLAVETLRRIRQASEPLRGRFCALGAAWFWPCTLAVAAAAIALSLDESAYQQHARVARERRIAQMERAADAARAEDKARLLRGEQPSTPRANPAAEPKLKNGSVRQGEAVPDEGPVSAAPLYKVTDLGTLGGATSTASDINAKGQVVGCADTASGHRHAFLYDNGKMTDLGTLAGPGGSFSEAHGINASGQVVGCAGPAGNKRHAFLYSDGKMTDLGAFFGSSSHAYRINASGQVVGASASRAFLYSSGKMVDLGTSGRPLRDKRTYLSNPGQLYISSEAYDINDRGQVVGYARGPGSTARETRAFLYSDGKITELGFFPGGSWSIACGINDRGQVVGYADTASGNTHAFLYADGRMTDLGTLGGSDCWARGINATGQVVGSANIASGTPHAYLYSDAKMTDLNHLVDPASGWTLGGATAINDNGWIVGWGGSRDGKSRAFLLTPTVDERPGGRGAHNKPVEASDQGAES